MFCVECGAEGEVIDGLCRECYARKHRFVDLPKTVDVTICAHCGAVKVSNRWERVQDAILRTVESALIVEDGVEYFLIPKIEEEDARNFKVTLDIEVRVHGITQEIMRETRVRVKTGVCRDCSRQRGSYYEAVVQLRARKRSPSEAEVEEALQMAKAITTSNDSFITKIDEVKGGVDIYMGKVNDGRALASQLSGRFGAPLKETKSTAGRKDGQDIFRSTFLVRLPAFSKGDLIPIDGRIYEISSFTKNKVNLEEITSGKRSSETMKDLERRPVLKREDYIVNAVVVSESMDEIQVMNPKDLRTVDIHRPKDFRSGTKELKVVVYEEDLHPYMVGSD